MTKKHFKAIAEVINSIDSEHNSAVMYRSILVSRLCVLFSRENERFNSSKFRDACYKELEEDENDTA